MPYPLNLANRIIIEPLATKWSDTERALLREGIGGIFLRARNFAATLPYSQWLAKYRLLIDEARTLTKNEKLIICIDHEGELRPGRAILRVPPPFTRFPAAGFWREENITELTTIIATELSSLGVNLLFGPVADIHLEASNPVIGARAFSSSPGEVARRCLTFCKALTAHGILPCAKHFPGHGRTKSDSHETLPVLDIDKQTLLNEELRPFTELIHAQIPLILTGHLLIPAIDPILPATISPALSISLLRDQLGFRGCVVGDALGMEAITPWIEREDFGSTLLNAQMDLILMVGDKLTPTHTKSVLDKLRFAAQSEEGAMLAQQSADRLAALSAALSTHQIAELADNTFKAHQASLRSSKHA